MARNQLSSFTDGSFLTVDVFLSSLIHREQTSDIKYLRISGFNRGKRPRNLVFSFNDSAYVYSSVKSGASQMLIPGVPMYNSGTGIDVYVSVRHSVGAWSLPSNLSDVVVLNNGSVSGIYINSVSASVDAQPILLIITDSTRTDSDVDPSKGTEAIIELFQQNGIVSTEIIQEGYNFVPDSLHIKMSSGVFLFGDVFQE